MRHASTSSARRLADHRPWWPREYARSSACSSSRSRSTGRSDRGGRSLPVPDLPVFGASSPPEPPEALDRVRATLAGPYPVHLLGRQHEDLSVADLAGARRLEDRVDHLLDLVLVGHHLDLHL